MVLTNHTNAIAELAVVQIHGEEYLLAPNLP